MSEPNSDQETLIVDAALLDQLEKDIRDEEHAQFEPFSHFTLFCPLVSLVVLETVVVTSTLLGVFVLDPHFSDSSGWTFVSCFVVPPALSWVAAVLFFLTSAKRAAPLFGMAEAVAAIFSLVAVSLTVIELHSPEPGPTSDGMMMGGYWETESVYFLLFTVHLFPVVWRLLICVEALRRNRRLVHPHPWFATKVMNVLKAMTTWCCVGFLFQDCVKERQQEHMCHHVYQTIYEFFIFAVSVVGYSEWFELFGIVLGLTGALAGLTHFFRLDLYLNGMAALVASVSIGNAIYRYVEFARDLDFAALAVFLSICVLFIRVKSMFHAYIEVKEAEYEFLVQLTKKSSAAAGGTADEPLPSFWSLALTTVASSLNSFEKSMQRRDSRNSFLTGAGSVFCCFTSLLLLGFVLKFTVLVAVDDATGFLGPGSSALDYELIYKSLDSAFFEPSGDCICAALTDNTFVFVDPEGQLLNCTSPVHPAVHALGVYFNYEHRYNASRHPPILCYVPAAADSVIPVDSLVGPEHVPLNETMILLDDRESLDYEHWKFTIWLVWQRTLYSVLISLLSCGACVLGCCSYTLATTKVVKKKKVVPHK